MYSSSDGQATGLLRQESLTYQTPEAAVSGLGDLRALAGVPESTRSTLLDPNSRATTGPVTGEATPRPPTQQARAGAP